MNSPWNNLDAATGTKNLYLNPAVIPAVNQAYEPYGQSLQTLIDDRLDDTSGYFGTEKNPLAALLEKAFNTTGTALTTYLQAQLSQTRDFVKTANDAAGAIQAADNA